MLPGQLALTFQDEARGSMPRGEIQRSAAFSSRRRAYRWELRREWEHGPAIAWVGLNPSRADADRDDPTTLREIGFSYRWGFGVLVKVNIYPFCSSTPGGLHAWRRTSAAGPGFLREAAERAAAAISHCDLFIAAWGNHADPDDVTMWLRAIDRVLGRSVAWHVVGINADGSPRHTLSPGRRRVPDNAQPMQWEIPSSIPAGSSVPTDRRDSGPAGTACLSRADQKPASVTSEVGSKRRGDRIPLAPLLAGASTSPERG
ncbi:hypothetical protein K32_24510 [Kaistia sp. 32K]|uniref:DUF1643 domain-containing protein n=1 Tax=Kaistia sp. 32K TaxID=2795690 RepID=UPI00191563A1|nr:DUF1643 domain-containing protein [Kaistia sp. 32K]BCP53834.1 hypothetical protein K32_24510 [Kaistia sp. 32K]